MPHVLPHELRLTPIESLIPHPRNARRHHDASLDESIAENGVYKPVVASSRSGYILAGHGLAERSRAAGIEEIPVMWIEGLDEAAELKILAVDNRASELSGYDETLLAELLQSVQSTSGGLEGTGYTQESFDQMIADAGKTIMKEARSKVNELRKTLAPDADTSPQLGGLEYRVIVDCANELHQKELLERFESEGLICKALIS